MDYRARGDWVEFSGAQIRVDEMAACASTIEVLVGIGNRVERRYSP